MSGHGNIETAVRATKLGAFDFLEKPLSIEKVTVVSANAVKHRRLEIENSRLREDNQSKYRILGGSVPMKALRWLAAHFISLRGPGHPPANRLEQSDPSHPPAVSAKCSETAAGRCPRTTPPTDNSYPRNGPCAAGSSPPFFGTREFRAVHLERFR